MLRWALAAALALAAPPHLLEGDALPPEVCARIIDAAERQGFSYAPDTIDRDDARRPPSVQLEVFEQDEVRAPEVMALVAPYLPRLRGLVDRAKRAKGVDTPTRFDWIFLRKYAAGRARDRLRAHKDGNLHSLNVFLNGRAEDGDRFAGGGSGGAQFAGGGSGGAQFAGGGLFLADGPEVDGVEVWTDGFLDDAAGVFVVPQRTGAAVVHDNTVWHGIAPLASGSKYSLLLFADMTDEQIDGDRATTAAFANNGAAPLALSWCGTAAEEGDCVAVATIASGATEFQETYADHVFVATDAAGRAVARWVVDGGDFRERFVYGEL
jgi:hypothetical protein